MILGIVACSPSRPTRAVVKDTAQRKHAPDFALKDANGKLVHLTDYQGKVVLLDFWATWCGPCRAQHPLYRQVAQRFHDNSGVVFLSIDADDDRSLVKPFLAEEKWPDTVYFEDGLTRALSVFAFPTTIVLDKRGQVFSRLSGFVPERYVETVTDRIHSALGSR